MGDQYCGTIVYLSSKITAEIIRSKHPDYYSYENQLFDIKITSCKGKIPNAYNVDKINVGMVLENVEGYLLIPKLAKFRGSQVEKYSHCRLKCNGQSYSVSSAAWRWSQRDFVRGGIDAIIVDFGVRDWLVKTVV